MAGVVPALIARDDVEAVGEEIDNLPLTLVPPLGSQDDYVTHFSQTYLFYRFRSTLRSDHRYVLSSMRPMSMPSARTPMVTATKVKTLVPGSRCPPKARSGVAMVMCA